MKKSFTIFLFFFYCYTHLLASIAPGFETKLINHLEEVNKEWQKYELSGTLDHSLIFENDVQRIRTHLYLVELYLRNSTDHNLSHDQLEKRQQALDILKTYYENECFPVNHYHPQRQPYFIDNFGTACAVGYLMIETGFEDIANQISKENNYAYVSELDIIYPELSQWAEAFGFTLDELAWIQPGYPPTQQYWNQVGNGGGTNGTINVMGNYQDQMLYIAGDFTEIDGTAANGIAAWNGSQWSGLGNGISGEIKDMIVTENGRIYIAGDFYVNDHPEIINLAYYQGGEWNGFNFSSIEGSINTIDFYGHLFIGGDFQLENSQEYIINDLAMISLSNLDAINYDGDFSVDGEVTDITHIGNNILVAGDFNETAVASSNPDINHLETTYMAYWSLSENNWTVGFEHDFEIIGSVLLHDGFIFTGERSMLDDFSFASVFGNGLWEDIGYFFPIDTDQDDFIRGIIPFKDRVIYYGNLRFEPVVGTWSRGIYIVNTPFTNSEQYYQEGADFNGRVTAAVSFQNEIYFAGDFTSVDGENFNGFVSSSFEGPNSIPEIPSNLDISVYSSLEQINIEYSSLDESIEFNVFNMNGQLMDSYFLNAGTGMESILVQTWASGIYVYQAVSKSGKIATGKLSVMR